jgi:hypothetical protein
MRKNFLPVSIIKTIKTLAASTFSSVLSDKDARRAVCCLDVSLSDSKYQKGESLILRYAHPAFRPG